MGRPRRRKSNSSQLYWIIGGSIAGVAFFAILIVSVVAFAAKGSKPMAAPTSYTVYNSEEDIFHIELPDGWNVKGGGKKDTLWVNAEKGSAAIKVTESLAGSLMGDIAGAGHSDPNGPDEQLRVSKVHELRQPIIAEEFNGYREGSPVMIRSGFGKTRQSPFTTSTGRGYRATALGAMTQLTVLCTCASKDWEVLQPAFEKVIASLGPGRLNR
jgi:hypothetical protein